MRRLSIELRLRCHFILVELDLPHTFTSQKADAFLVFLSFLDNSRVFDHLLMDLGVVSMLLLDQPQLLRIFGRAIGHSPL